MKLLPVLMTASVSTRGMIGTCFTDKEREAMYVGALTYYINHFISNQEMQIVFVENSGWDLEHLKSQLPRFDEERVEFISLPIDIFDISRGKGYNEMLLINETIKYSKSIAKSGAFFKVTGRYPIYNLDRFVAQARKAMFEKGVDLFCDIKDHKLYDYLHLGWNGHSFECRMFAVTTDFYLRNMTKIYCGCNDSTHDFAENELYKFVKGIENNGVIVPRFRQEPHFGGLEGSDIDAWSATKGQDSLKGKFKRLVGNFFRKCMPWFWF